MPVAPHAHTCPRLVSHPALAVLVRPQAVLKFNLQRVLGDPAGEQDRPLVVRRANMRKPAASLMIGGAAGLQAAAAGVSGNSAFSSGSNAGLMSMSATHATGMDLQQQGSIGQMGLGEMPYYMQPLMAMQVRGTAKPHRYGRVGGGGAPGEAYCCTRVVADEC